MTQQPQKSHKQDILPKNLQIDQSLFLCILRDACYEYHFVSEDFYASGTQDVEVTRSVNQYMYSVHVCAFEQDMLFPGENYSLYFVASYRPHLSHFWANVIFAIPT